MRRLGLAFGLLSALSTYAAASDYDCAYDPKLSHLSRIVAADSTGAPLYGQALNDTNDKSHERTLNLRDHEVILTFDDGPLGANTQLVIDTLQKHCVKATFFSVGRMAQANPKLLQELDRRGHTVGSHTWSHPRGMDQLAADDIKLEIEKGFAAVSQAMGKPIAPFFRFPGLRDSKVALDYLGARNISVWSVDVISGDTDPGASSARITHDVLARIRPLGRGIILMHDIKRPTAEALDGILTELEKEGYRFVHVVSNTYYKPDPEILSRSDIFRNSPETATITGRWLASAKQEVKDGSVDVMHTEWLDLQQADEQLLKAQAPEPVHPAAAQPNAVYTATGWMTSGQVR